MGDAGAFGGEGAENDLTVPTCASLAYETKENVGHAMNGIMERRVLLEEPCMT